MYRTFYRQICEDAKDERDAENAYYLGFRMLNRRGGEFGGCIEVAFLSCSEGSSWKLGSGCVFIRHMCLLLRIAVAAKDMMCLSAV